MLEKFHILVRKIKRIFGARLNVVADAPKAQLIVTVK